MAKNPLERLATLGAERMMRMTEKMPSDVEPLGAQKLSREEQIQRYTEVRDNPQAWSQIIAERGLDEAIKYWQTMEVRYARQV